MSAVVIRGDARQLPLPDDSADLIVTSPPYFGLRSYTDGGAHYAAQIGSEDTPAAYVAALLDCTREWMRVLKPSGSLWVNLGDKYVSRQSFYDQTDGGSWWKIHGEKGDQRPNGKKVADPRGERSRSHYLTEVSGIPAKSLMGLPWRYALGAIDDLGLILRAEVIWAKPNGLPESVTDRVRRSHEQWFHLTMQPRYYSAVDEIREPHQPQSIARTQRNRFAPDLSQTGVGSPNTLSPGKACNPLGKLPGSVWTIPTQPLTVPPGLGVDHFAAFPMEWPRRIIQGWSPAAICAVCGEGRRPVVDRPSPFGHVGRSVRDIEASGQVKYGATSQMNLSGGPRAKWKAEHPDAITGYACACPTPDAPTRPSVVLDPFGGTGTTALIASVLGRTGISVDRSADYCRLAAWRTTDPGQRAAAMQVPKPPAQLPGQGELEMTS